MSDRWLTSATLSGVSDVSDRWLAQPYQASSFHDSTEKWHHFLVNLIPLPKSGLVCSSKALSSSTHELFVKVENDLGIIPHKMSSGRINNHSPH